MSANLTRRVTESGHVSFVLTEQSTETLGGENLSLLLQKRNSRNTSDLKIKQKASQLMPKEHCEKETSTNRRLYVGKDKDN